MSNDANDFLGCGWSFPPTFDSKQCTVRMVAAEQDIVQSLQILFSTAKTERVMLHDYGCELNSVVFESIHAALAQRVRSLLADAILNYEPRIEVHDDDIEIAAVPGELGMLLVKLSYRIRQTNTRSNMVFPFYTIEGSNVRQIEAA